MARVTLPEIVDAVADKLRLATVIMPGELVARAFTVQSYDELTEAIQDIPAIQVFLDGITVDSNTTTDRHTMRVGTQKSTLSLVVRTFARQRSNVNDDMAAVLACWDAVEATLEQVSLDCQPFFGLEAIRSFHWTAAPMLYDYGRVLYVGIEHTLTLEVF